jgi:hypothetical protein
MKSLLLATALGLVAGAASANDFEPSMRYYTENEVLVWTSDPVLIDAIRKQNRRHAELSDADITALDRRWQAEVNAESRPTIDGVLSNPASDFLRDRQAASAGVISEVFVMDNRGLNVAASDATSDYWQGDEAKWQKTYLRGPGAVHVGDVEMDESTQQFQAQVSVSVVDPASGAVIGAVTVGVNVDAL